MPRVVIFRNNLFRVSEPFITGQAQALRRYQPLYLGRQRFGPAPAGADARAIVDGGRAWPAIAWHTVSRDPRSLLRLLGNDRPALVHAHFGTDGVYALAVAQALGVPLVTTFHGYDATLSTAALLTSPAWANFPLFRRRLAAQGALFLCVSHFIRDRVLAMGFPPARTLVHHTGVDCTAIGLRDAGDEQPIVVHAARLVEMKGTEYLLRAFARLGGTPAATLVIIGDGPLRGRLQRLAGTLGLGAKVRFLGALAHDDTLGWIRRAAILALPSVPTATGRVEGLGMVLLEAAAAGVPVVASRVGGITDAVVDGQTGLLAPPRDVAVLADQLAALLADPDRRRRMGLAGRALVQQAFDGARQTALLEARYDTVVACNAARACGQLPPAGCGW